jgi:hypothetical protein
MIVVQMLKELIPHYDTVIYMFKLDEDGDIVGSEMVPFSLYDIGDEEHFDGVVEVQTFNFLGIGFFPKTVSIPCGWDGNEL